MSLEKKLLNIYLSENEIETLFEERKTSLRHYIQMIGMNWKMMSQEQIDKIANSQAYKQFKEMRAIKQKQRSLGEDIHTPKEYEPSKKYKHLDKRHISRQQYYAGLLNKGYSALRTAPLYKSTGPKGYKARKTDVITFRKQDISPYTGKLRTTDTITKRELHKRREYTGKAATYEGFKSFLESIHDMKKKKIPKMTNMREITPEDEKQCEKEFEITKTLTGDKDTNTIQINPNMKIIRKSEKDKKEKKEQIKKPAAMKNVPDDGKEKND